MSKVDSTMSSFGEVRFGRWRGSKCSVNALPVLKNTFETHLFASRSAYLFQCSSEEAWQRSVWFSLSVEPALIMIMTIRGNPRLIADDIIIIFVPSLVTTANVRQTVFHLLSSSLGSTVND